MKRGKVEQRDDWLWQPSGWCVSQAGLETDLMGKLCSPVQWTQCVTNQFSQFSPEGLQLWLGVWELAFLSLCQVWGRCQEGGRLEGQNKPTEMLCFHRLAGQYDSHPSDLSSSDVVTRSFCLVLRLVLKSSCRLSPCDRLPSSWLFPSVWLLAPPSLCPPVSRSPVSNRLRLPVYLNPVRLIPQGGVVPIGSCLSACLVVCYLEIPNYVLLWKRLSALGSSLSLRPPWRPRGWDDSLFYKQEIYQLNKRTADSCDKLLC